MAKWRDRFSNWLVIAVALVGVAVLFALKLLLVHFFISPHP